MNEVLIRITPIISIFLIGFLLKKFRVFTIQNAEAMLHVVFYVALPALILLSMIHTPISPEFFFLPLICFITAFASVPILLLAGRSLRLQRATMGAFLVGPLIMNTSFVIPFLLTAYGQESIARLSVFDVANNIVIYTVSFYFAHGYGSKGVKKGMLKTIVRSPILYALVLGLILNQTKTPMPDPLVQLLQSFGNMTIPLVMIALGVYFSPAITNLTATILSVTIRMAVGFLMSFLLCYLFHLSGLNRAVVIIACSAPVGFTTLTFSAITGLDSGFAASTVSYSILVGLFTTPLLILFLAH